MEKPSQCASSCPYQCEQRHATFVSLGQKKGDYQMCRGRFAVP